MTTACGNVSIGSRLARIAARLSGRIAIVERDATVSYGQLDRVATSIARRIEAAEGTRPGLVCLLFENKIAAIEAIFGASKCGRAYVPLDAGDPDERLRFILQDSEPVAMLTERSLLERAHALVPAGCAVIDVERLGPEDAACPLPDVGAGTPANLYYTSGSTGQPKGVCQTHRNVLFFADAYANTLRIGETDRLSLLYTLSFSASMMDIFSGLFNGATLCAYDVRRGGIALLAEWLDRERITVLHAVPTVFRGLFSALAPERKLEHLRAIDLGGEAVFAGDVELFRRHTPENCILVNHLAATEANVIAQHVVEHRSPRAADGILPVGRSPRGLSVRVRREDGSAAGTNEVGDIVVSSAHVSPGYWRRPELNAAAFSTDPVEPGGRCYFTADLGRIDAEGNLHFLGRKGSRVKIRGQSIDLSELEAALSACPGVIKSAVVATSDEPQSEPDKLVAFLVIGENAERNPLFIRRRLATRLPSYMLPGAFVFLDALPLTATGKIDRIALAAIRPPPVDRLREVEPPRDDLERAVAGMFEQLLRQMPIGRDDDFFMLGGDSLSLAELHTRLLDQFGVSLSNVHEDVTVAGIAASIGRNRDPASGAAVSMPVLLPLREMGSAPPMFIVHGRMGLPFVSPHFLNLLGDDLPVWAFQARGLDGMHEPHSTIEAMAADYVSEMRQRRPKGPYFLAALCAGALIANVMARTLRAAGELVLPLLLFDPPERRLRAAVTEESLLFRLKARRAENRFLTPIEDPRYAAAAVRTARAFEHAIWNHQPQAYDGAVYMLSSRQRMLGANPSYLKKIFTGRVKRFEVGTTHAEALDPRTPAFAEYLARCLGLILGAVGEPDAPVDVPSGFAGVDRRRSRVPFAGIDRRRSRAALFEGQREAS
jgi:amino acid adenylation domain-containing protein